MLRRQTIDQGPAPGRLWITPLCHRIVGCSKDEPSLHDLEGSRPCFWRGEVVATRKSTDVLAFSRGLGWGPVRGVQQQGEASLLDTYAFARVTCFGCCD